MSVHASVPLAPAIPPTGEETRVPSPDPSTRLEPAQARATILPLPRGELRPEEERDPRPPERLTLSAPAKPIRYFDELKRAMEFLARDPRVLFLGQAVASPGTAMSNTLKDVPLAKLLELPVNEEMQMGMTNGLALAGLVPVSIFPRWNFLLLAVNQIVNHLDKFALMSNGGYQPRVILRTGIGSERPLHPQHQHVGDYTDAFRLMCPRLEVIRLEEPAEIFPAYQKALERTDGKSTLLVEYGDYHSEK